MGMHDCRFLVVFDINEDLKLRQNLHFSRRAISQLLERTCIYHFWTNMCGITSNFATMFSIDLFCCIRLCATVPLLLYCVQGSPILTDLALFSRLSSEDLT